MSKTSTLNIEGMKDSPLLVYAKEGDFHGVISALDVGANASSELLHLAILAGKVRVVRAVLSRGIGIENASILYRYRPLHYAAQHGHAHVVEELLNAGADHTAVELRGRMAVHIAASLGHLDVLKVMKSHGCDINVIADNRYKQTPLHYAAYEGKLSAVKWLVQNGAVLDAKDGYGNTPLSCACRRKQKDVIYWLQYGQEHQPSTDNGSLYSSEDEDKNANNNHAKCISSNNDPEIPEICYNSVEGICNYINGCKRLHLNRHYHWQAKEPLGSWLNFPDNIVTFLEVSFCDPVKDGVDLPALNEEIECSADYLSDIMGKDSWYCHFKDMTLADPSGRRILKTRRLTSELVDGKLPKPSAYAWYFLDKHNNWVKYGDVDTTGEKQFMCNINSSEVEKLYQRNPSQSIFFKNVQYQYSLDFTTMIQQNLSTNVVREVRRRPLPHTVKEAQINIGTITDSLRYPNSWETMETNEHVRRVKVSQNSKEYKDVCNSFIAAINVNNVVKIERIQNPFLWFAFQNKVREMTAVYGNVYEVNVKQLFHGTSSDVVDNICAENFDWRLHGSKTGQLYGRGTYFSPYAKTAYAYCRADNYSNCYLFLAKVAIGTYVVGDVNMVRPPLNPKTNKLYDSTVDRVHNPNIIVKYDKQEYYPEYIVTVKNANGACTVS
ncbi:Poly (ADP-ribose) polymerase [Halocaridina rubra]|uniref:Poly [ADP-ribose] polymerase n=1 Tax=Halocaridina rubra TaxID=373956 RepID=A0AAN8XFF7_HALRR